MATSRCHRMDAALISTPPITARIPSASRRLTRGFPWRAFRTRSISTRTWRCAKARSLRMHGRGYPDRALGGRAMVLPVLGLGMQPALGIFRLHLHVHHTIDLVSVVAVAEE